MRYSKTAVVLACAVTTVACGTASEKDMNGSVQDGGPPPLEKACGPEVGIVTLGADWQDDADSIAELYAYAKQAGATSTYLYSGATWAEAEKTPGKFDFANTGPQIEASKAYGFEASALDIPLPFFFGEPSVPADITFVSYDDEVLVSRYLRFVEALLEEYGSPSHVVLHSEGAGSAFSAGAKEFEQFCSMVGSAARFIKETFPGTLVSNYNTDYESDAISRCLNEEMTWWADGLVLDVPAAEMPAAIVAKLDRVRKFAGGKPIGLVEVNYSSGDTDGGRTVEDQARFVDEFFDYLAAHPRAFGFVNWYGIFDETPELTRAWVTAQFGELGEAFVEGMIAQWSNQGLRYRDGGAKPAWTRWVERTQALQAANATACGDASSGR